MGFEPAPPSESTVGVTSDKIMVSNISIDRLELGTFSPRMQFDTNYVAKLAEDIKAEGQLKPIMVRPHPKEPNKYQVIDGEHRVRALQKLGNSLVRAEIHALSDEDAYYRAMRINQLHGKRLEELEEACHINKMKALFEYSEDQIAKRFTRSQSWVRDRLTLALSLAPQVEEHVSSRLLTSTHAVEIARLPKGEQAKVADVVAQKNLSIKATRGFVQAVKKAETAEQKERILEKPLELYVQTFKDPKQLETALLTIKPEDDFLAKTKEIKTEEQAKEFFAESKPEEATATFQCPGCGKQLRVDWAKGEVRWD
jgi:ParB/RepB/Spo0J family partition protein